MTFVISTVDTSKLTPVSTVPVSAQTSMCLEFLAGTTPLGSSSHVTTDVVAGTTPLGSSLLVTTDVVAVPGINKIFRPRDVSIRSILPYQYC